LRHGGSISANARLGAAVQSARFEEVGRFVVDIGVLSSKVPDLVENRRAQEARIRSAEAVLPVDPHIGERRAGLGFPTSLGARGCSELLRAAFTDIGRTARLEPLFDVDSSILEVLGAALCVLVVQPITNAPHGVSYFALESGIALGRVETKWVDEPDRVTSGEDVGSCGNPLLG
jgi:hypothetical protein